MFWKIQIQHIRIMRGKNQLLICTDSFQHDTENTFFNITLNIREMFIAIIECAFPGNHSSEKHCNINSFCRPAGENVTIQKFPILNNDFRITATNNKCVLQIFRQAYILQSWIKRTDYCMKCPQ